MKKLFALLLGVGLLPQITSADPEAWSRFRGPNGTGISQAKTIPVEVTDKDIRWKVDIPGLGHSSPVIRDHKIYLTTTTGAEVRTLICLATKDGAELWQKTFPLESHKQHKHNNYSSSTPCIDDDHLYLYWADPGKVQVRALSHAGEPVWDRTLKPFQAAHGSGLSLMVVGDTLVVPNDHEGEGSYIVGLHRDSGKTLWKRDRGTAKASYATPMIYNNPAGEEELIYVSTASGLTSLNPKTGALNWEVPELYALRTVASPTMTDGVIFTMCGEGGAGKDAAAIRPGTKDKKPEILYRMNKTLPYSVTPIAYQGHFYLWSDRGIGTCIEAATGKQVWQARIGGNYYTSPLCIDGKLYSISREGELVVLATGSEFKVLSRRQLGEGTQATPAVYKGQLFVRLKSELLCIGGE